MSDTTSTPGPWVVDSDLDHPALHTIWQRGTYLLVARTCFAPSSKANAHLIAACPTMLEALRLIDEFAWTAVAADCEESRIELNRRVSACRAAIAKAEGKP